jgi:hypothetical protein
MSKKMGQILDKTANISMLAVLLLVLIVSSQERERFIALPGWQQDVNSLESQLDTMNFLQQFIHIYKNKLENKSTWLELKIISHYDYMEMCNRSNGMANWNCNNNGERPNRIYVGLINKEVHKRKSTSDTLLIRDRLPNLKSYPQRLNRCRQQYDIQNNSEWITLIEEGASHYGRPKNEIEMSHLVLPIIDDTVVCNDLKMSLVEFKKRAQE